ncbi:disulfide bond formation protein B [Paracoccus sp. S-4012]|uniref:disulfide bond formation protein B n=1 Tax=Paracoccus sp. S-4012 TaxID=2665648 RepID=UPI0012B0BB28|nr:disulfide bond formation protein B [Paracoccus sp. S-4012]MRX51323.1 disulfide bond formation protein B [Paracoccus sp. S-4012]
MPDLDRRQIMALAGAGSALLLLAAFGFQWAGYAPCALCITARWPHVAAIVVAVVAWITGGARFWALLGAAAMVAVVGISVYHAGIEFDWWAGPAACSGGAAGIGALSVQDLLARIEAAPVIRCDEPAVLILGFSMAVWNGVLSAVLAVVWLIAWRRA